MRDSTLYEEVGAVIARRRKALGFTQADIAAALGMSRAAVTNIEAGRQNLYLHQLYALAKALRMSDISELLPRTLVESSKESRSEFLIASSQGVLDDDLQAEIAASLHRALRTSQ
jgi:transcriptional regulator with XRE-family HTH domain